MSGLFWVVLVSGVISGLVGSFPGHSHITQEHSMGAFDVKFVPGVTQLQYSRRDSNLGGAESLG